MATSNHSDDDPSLDRIHDILANPARRALLKLLRETDPLTMEAAADHLAETHQNDLDQIKIVLYHRHLPKMADAQVIDYDPEAGQIWPTDATKTAYDLLK